MAQAKTARRTQIDRQGRIVIPSEIREELGLEPGQELTLVIEDGDIRLMTKQRALRRFQEMVREKTKGRSLVDELMSERRDAATRE